MSGKSQFNENRTSDGRQTLKDRKSTPKTSLSSDESDSKFDEEYETFDYEEIIQPDKPIDTFSYTE